MDISILRYELIIYSLIFNLCDAVIYILRDTAVSADVFCQILFETESNISIK